MTGKTHFKIVTTLAFIAFIFFMFYRIGNSMFNADAHFWYTRTQKFTKAVLKGDWADTYQNPKPGVTVMWVSGVFLESFLRLYEKIYHFRPFLYTYDTFPYIETVVKLPLIIITILSLWFFYKTLKKYLGDFAAAASLIILAFQPFYIGVSRFFHGDGTLTSFMLISTLFLFKFILEGKKKNLIFSGIFAGLSFLTKMQAVFLFLYIPLLLLIGAFEKLFAGKIKEAVGIKNIFNKVSLRYILKTSFSQNILWLPASLLTVFLLFPALWVKPVATLKDMFFEARVVTEEGRNSSGGDNITYLKAVPTIIPSVVLLLLVFGLFFILKNFKILEQNRKTIYLFSLIYIFFYTMQMLLVYQKSERYLLPLFPFISIVAGFGFEQAVIIVQKLFKKRLIDEIFLYPLLGGFVIYTSTFAPHFTAMTETAPWGSLYCNAAEYLNNKPDAVNLNVVAVTKEHTFRPFFKGKTYGKSETIPNNRQPDYVIVHDQTYLPEKYKYCKFEKNITFKNRVFWEIYKCR